ncbi:MAG: hypothetical protein WD555_06290 [Fulvivirga sp.]
MRKILVICLILAQMGCGGSLSDEQRKALKKEMEMREIKKVSEEEIFKKGLEIGNELVPQLKPGETDIVAHANGVEIFLADTAATNLTSEHLKIFEAYRFSPEIEDLRDNVQASGDTVIYSAPIIEDGQFKGVWFINIPLRKIVLAL